MSRKLLREMTWLEKLLEVKRVANFVDAAFDPLSSADTIIKDGNVTEFIRERTRCYRDSWLNPLLNDLIKREKKAVERRKVRKR